MRYLVLGVAFAIYTAGASIVYAEGCHSTCGKGQTYNQETGACVPQADSA